MCIIGSTYIKLANTEYEKVYSQNTEIEGYAIILSEAKETEYKKTYTIKIVGDSQNENKKFILKINKNAKLDLKYGDFIKIKGEYEKPSIARNYKGFDYSIYLKTKGIYGNISASSNNVKILEKGKINFISKTINNIRNGIIENSKNIISNENLSGLLIGILVGDTSYTDEDTVSSFKDSSLAHMLAVSGQHIVYIILAVSFALKMSKVGKRAEYILSICILVLFMLITGFSPSVFRAGLMGILLIISYIVHRKLDTYTGLGLAIIIILFINPFSIYDIGLWLSYGGTLGIILFHNIISNLFNIEFKNEIFQKLYDFVKEMLVVTISAQILIIPIMILNFNQISIMFWLSNVLASPIIAICLISGFVIILISFVCLQIAQMLAIPLEWSLNSLVLIAEKVAIIPFSNAIVPTPKIIWVILYYAILGVLLYYNSKNKKIYHFQKIITNKIKKYIKPIFVSIIILCVITYGIKILNSSMFIHFIDVGQGDSTLIITNTGKKILIDGGGAPTYDVGKNVLLPYLLDRGITKIDYVMISHFDSDHCLGVFTVMENIKIRNIIIPKQIKSSENYTRFIELAKQAKTKVIQVKTGDRIFIDKQIYFDIIWPEEKQITENVLNNNSIVAKLVYGKFSILFTGDIEEIAEKVIVKKYSNKLKANILKIAHHRF